MHTGSSKSQHLLFIVNLIPSIHVSEATSSSSHRSGYVTVSDKKINIIAVCFNFFFFCIKLLFQDDTSSGPSIIWENHTYASSNWEAC